MNLIDEGKGPAVVLLHGCPGTLTFLAPLVEALSPTRRVIAPELPGYGASPPLEGPYSFDRVQAMLEDLLLARGVRECALVGHSAGAYRAIGLALGSTRVRATHLVTLGGLAGLDPEVRAAFRQFADLARQGFDFRPMWLGRMAAPGFAERFPQRVGEVMSWMTPRRAPCSPPSSTRSRAAPTIAPGSASWPSPSPRASASTTPRRRPCAAKRSLAAFAGASCRSSAAAATRSCTRTARRRSGRWRRPCRRNGRRTAGFGCKTPAMRLSHGFLAVVLAGVFAAGCVGGSKGLSAEEKQKLAPYILDAAPADIPHKLDVNFENKVHLIGYKFDPEMAKPGQEVKITYYWRCDDTLEDGWLLFTHTKDSGSGKMGNLDYVGPLREHDPHSESHQVLGPERWEKGKYYVDTQIYKVPDDVTGSEITVYTGIWKGDARLRIISGPNDGDNSAIVGSIKTGLAPKDEHAANDVPTLTIVKLADGAKITIDGKGDEKEWGGAASTGPFVDVGTGKPNTTFPVNASAKLMWDDKDLYVLVQVQEAGFYTGFTDAKAQPKDFTAAGQPKLWTKDTVEMMVEPDAVGSNTNYYELQINPQNKIFKSQFDTLQQPNGGPNGPFGHEDWVPKLESAVTIQKGPDGKPTGYTVEAAIPWTAYAKAANHPPKPGDVWRVNFYAMKNNGGVAWSPILGQGNFHKASRFGKVVWTVPGMPVAAASASAGHAMGASLAAAPGSDGAQRPRIMMPPHPFHLSKLPTAP